MTEEEKKKMADLEKSVGELTAKVKERDSTITTYQNTLKQKDELIAQKNTDIVEARKQYEKKYKKLSEMTDAEKDQLSEAEKDLIARTEAHEADVAQFKKDQEERQAKEVDARRTAAINKLVGNNPDLAKKVADNYGRIKDSDKATTEDEISKLAGDAFNLLGEEKPKPISFDQNGEAPGDSLKTSTDETKLKSLAEELNLPTEAPAVNNGGGAGTN